MVGVEVKVYLEIDHTDQPDIGEPPQGAKRAHLGGMGDWVPQNSRETSRRRCGAPSTSRPRRVSQDEAPCRPVPIRLAGGHTHTAWPRIHRPHPEWKTGLLLRPLSG
jgi:hypothetical protein